MMIGLICFRVCSSPMTLTLLAFPVLCLFCMLLFRFLVSRVLRFRFAFVVSFFAWLFRLGWLCVVRVFCPWGGRAALGGGRMHGMRML